MSSVLQKIWAFVESKKGSRITLCGIYVAAVLFMLLSMGTTVYGPTHFDDEVRYWNTARQLYTGEFQIANYHHSPPLYPISLLPAFIFFSVSKAYAAAKVLNYVYITSVIFPSYFLMRSFANRGLSLLVASLVLLLPTQVVIPRSMISENLFYPLFLWAVCLAFRNFSSRDSRWRIIENVGFGIICGLLVLTRYIALAVIPAFFIIWWLKPLDDEKLPLLISKKKVLHAASVFLPFLLVVGVWVLLGLRENVPLKELLGFGIADDSNPAQLGRRRFVMWAVFYLSYAILIAAPYLGILATAIFQIRLKDWRSTTNRWLIAVALICVFFLLACVRHSWRAAYNYPDPVKIQGRYILYFAPLFLIAAFTIIKTMQLPKLSRSSYWLVMVVVGQLVALAFFILFKGAVYLGRPLQVSVNSSDGIFMRQLDTIFLLGFFIILFASVFFIGRSKARFYTTFALLLTGFYIFGNSQMYTKFLKPSQYSNYQAVQLITLLEAKYEPGTKIRNAEINLSVTDRIKSSNCRYWVSTMKFHGFTDVQCVRNHQTGEDDPTVFVAQVGEDEFTLRSLGKNPVDVKGHVLFDFRGEYFVIE